VLCSAFIRSGVVVRINLHVCRDIVAKNPLWLERLIRCGILVFRSQKLIDVLSG
jgi:hypothetical protein